MQNELAEVALNDLIDSDAGGSQPGLFIYPGIGRLKRIGEDNGQGDRKR